MKRNDNNKLAFTLIEILVAVAVIGIISTVAVVLLNTGRAGSRDTKRLADINRIQTALRMYYNDYKTYPTTAEWGTKLATGSNVYLEKIPVAPQTSEGDCGASSSSYIYESDGSTYTLKFCLGTKVGDYVAGFKEATPDGIIATSAPAAPVHVKSWRVVANSSIPGTGSTTSRSWYSVDMSNDGQTIIAGVYGTYMYRSIDGGNTFSEINSYGTGLTWNVACSADGTKMVASTVNASGSTYLGPLYISTNSGATWSTISSAGSKYWNGVSISDNGSVILGVVYKGYPFISTDSGATWVQRGNYGYYHGGDCSSDCSKMLVIPSGSYVTVSTNTGLNWSQKTALSTKTWYIKSVSSDGSKMVTGSTSHPSYPVTVLYISTDYGANWTSRAPVAGGEWIAGAYSKDGSLVVVASYNGYLYSSTDDGVTWTEQTSAGARKWRSLAVNNDGKIVAVVENGDIYIYD